MTVTLFHNPRCSTSRNALALLREHGVEPKIVEYLKTGWERATLERLAAQVGGVRALLRVKEDGAKVLLPTDCPDAAILDAMIVDPILVERPIVETAKGVRIGRPVERVLEVV